MIFTGFNQLYASSNIWAQILPACPSTTFCMSWFGGGSVEKRGLNSNWPVAGSACDVFLCWPRLTRFSGQKETLLPRTKRVKRPQNPFKFIEEKLSSCSCPAFLATKNLVQWLVWPGITLMSVTRPAKDKSSPGVYLIRKELVLDVIPVYPCKAYWTSKINAVIPDTAPWMWWS
jgi:hypothetical protein